MFLNGRQRPELAPLILMGHYDVVPVEAAVTAQWTRAPFSGDITDSCIWGRGAIDDKNGVIAILEAAESLLRKGFVPQRTLYLCFGHDEEIRGPSTSWVVDYLRQRGIHPEMVLDEGGEISDGVVNFFPMTDAKGAHGINERLPVIDLRRGIHLMSTIIEESSLEF
jgi:carboxypeptidase PM20D1